MVNDLLPYGGWGSSARGDHRTQGMQWKVELFLRFNQGQCHRRNQQNIAGLMGLNSCQSFCSIKFGLGNDGAAHKHTGKQTFHIAVHMVERK